MNGFSARSLYLQVRDALVERIVTRQWAPGTMLPNETDLAREFGVSPGTMRKALDLLEAMRLVTRRQGRGAMVNDPANGELATRYNGIRSANGAANSEEVVSGEITKATPNEIECARLQLASADHVLRVQRRRKKAGRTYLVEDTSMPAVTFPGLIDEQDAGSAITLLAARHGIVLGKAAERLSIQVPRPEVADALSIPPATRILVLDRVVLALDARPIEWRVAWCRLEGGYYLAEMH